MKISEISQKKTLNGKKIENCGTYCIAFNLIFDIKNQIFQRIQNSILISDFIRNFRSIERRNENSWCLHIQSRNDIRSNFWCCCCCQSKNWNLWMLCEHEFQSSVFWTKVMAPRTEFFMKKFVRMGNAVFLRRKI